MNVTDLGGPADPGPPHGPAAALDARHLRMYRGGFWLFILAESFGFVTLFAVRFLLAGTGRPAGFDGLLGGLITIAFVASAVPAGGALRAIAAGEAAAMATRLAAAFGLGVVALALVVADWATFPLAATSRFAGTYLVSTGFHAIHVLVGLLFLAALWSSGRRGRFGPDNHWLVEAGVRFWLFVVTVWIMLYVVFYWL